MRTILNWNENWQFMKGELPGSDVWEAVTLPHTWNAFDGQDGGGDYYQGTGCYRKTFAKPEGHEVYVRFGAASKMAEVFCNGQKIGEHRGGFSAFVLELTPWLKEEENVLDVVVSNDSQLPIYPRMADFTFFGGLYRGVELLCFNGAEHFDVNVCGADGLFVKPYADGKVIALLHTASCARVQVEILDMEGNAVASARGNGNGELAELHLTVSAPHLWDGLADPYLYTVKAMLGEGLDEIETKIGFRSFSVDAAEGFFLNGRSYPLHGVTRHQCREDMGWALSEKEHLEDMALIREIGANTLRLGHYQHAPFWMDLCDRHGLVVWAEIPFISVYDDRREADENLRTQMKELIFQHFNHPSICFWGIGNELGIGGESENLFSMLEELNTMVKSMDPDRLTTIAVVSATTTDSRQFKITDLASYNEYMGWYEGKPEDHGAFCDERHGQIPTIPMGISEYGADCLTTWHSAEPKCKDYTEEYQAIVHEKAYLDFEKRPYLWATWMWNMFDFAADGRDEGGCKGKNNKGLVTFDRKTKKQAFYFYKAMWSKEPFVYLTGKRFVKRAEEQIEVKIYSNAKEVSLWANGKYLGSKAGRGIFLFEDVELKEGYNELIARTPGGQEDTLILEKVAEPCQDYIFKESKDVTANVAQWFADFQAENQILEIKEGYLSVEDSTEEIYRYPEGREAVRELIQKPLAIDNPGGAARLESGGALTFMSLWNHIGKYFPDKALYLLNERLNKIKKEN